MGEPVQKPLVQWRVAPEPPAAESVMFATLPAQKLLLSEAAEVGAVARALMVRRALEVAGAAHGAAGFAVRRSMMAPAAMSLGPGV